ncbi:MAG: hypothetical protein R3200_09890 [Xanthomonadales bacterium]|nr:hypothetical protein [Xanthomonadales bacterium]
MRILVILLFVAGVLLKATAADSTRLLLEFDRRSDGIAAEVQDDIPLLRLYESGRLLIHFPFYTKRAGLWEDWLTLGEVQNLLDTLQANGVFSVDGDLLEQAIEAANRRKTAMEGVVTTRSESVKTVFRSHESAPAGDLELVVSNLQSRARELGIADLEGLATAEEILLELANSEDLVRIEDAAVPEAQQ